MPTPTARPLDGQEPTDHAEEPFFIGPWVVAVFWHDPASGRLCTIVMPTATTNRSASQEEFDAIHATRLEQQQVPDASASERAARTALGEALRPDERIAIDRALRVGFRIVGFCDLGAWIWPVRVLAGTDELRGVYWLNAANGVLRPIAARQ